MLVWHVGKVPIHVHLSERASDWAFADHRPSASKVYREEQWLAGITSFLPPGFLALPPFPRSIRRLEGMCKIPEDESRDIVMILRGHLPDGTRSGFGIHI
jgi:hypothetical protein